MLIECIHPVCLGILWSMSVIQRCLWLACRRQKLFASEETWSAARESGKFAVFFVG